MDLSENFDLWDPKFSLLRGKVWRTNIYILFLPHCIFVFFDYICYFVMWSMGVGWDTVWLKLLVWRIKRSTGFKRGYRIPGKVVTGRVRRSVFGPDAWERRETVGVCNTCLRDAETLNVLGHRPLSHGACGVSLTPVFPFTYGPSEF